MLALPRVSLVMCGVCSKFTFTFTFVQPTVSVYSNQRQMGATRVRQLGLVCVGLHQSIPRGPDTPLRCGACPPMPLCSYSST